MKIKKLALACTIAMPFIYGCSNDDVGVIDPTPPPVAEIGPQDFIEQWSLQDIGFQDQGYADLADSEGLNAGDGSQTITYRFRIPNATAVQQIIQKGNTSSGIDGWSVFTSQSRIWFRSRFGGRSDISFDMTEADFNQWHHITAVLNQDKNVMEAWVNGEKMAAGSGEYGEALIPGFYQTDDPIRVHQRKPGYMIDDLRFYNRVLSEEEARSFFNSDNQAPVAELSYSQVADQNYQFSAAGSSDPEGQALQYIWDFGNGDIAFGETVEHDFIWGGDYAVKLTVVDPWYETSTVEEIIEIDGEPAPFRETTVFPLGGSDGYACFRIPTIIQAGNNDLLAFAEGRVNGCGDYGNINIVMRRSTDNGQTWGDVETLQGEDWELMEQNVSVVYDEFFQHKDASGKLLYNEDGTERTGQLLKVWNWANGHEWDITDANNEGQYERKVFMARSLDHGETWIDKKDITDEVRIPGQYYHTPPLGAAIQLTTDKAQDQGRFGRLLFAGQYNPEWASSAVYNYNYAFWTDDGGNTWEIGGRLESTPLNEVQALELANGDIMFNSRNYSSSGGRVGYRGVTISEDGGRTFGETIDDINLREPAVAASTIRYTRDDMHDKNRLLFSHPDASSRVNMSVKMSYDEGESWEVNKVINPGAGAYSDLVIDSDMNIGLLYETSGNEIRYANFTLDWLTDGEDSLNPETTKN